MPPPSNAPVCCWVIVILIALPTHAVNLPDVAVEACTGNFLVVPFTAHSHCTRQRLPCCCPCCVWPLQAQQSVHCCTSPHRLSTCPTSLSPHAPEICLLFPLLCVAIASVAVCPSLPLLHVAIASAEICPYLGTPTTHLALPLLRMPLICPSLHLPHAPATLSFCQLLTALLLTLPAAESFFG